MARLELDQKRVEVEAAGRQLEAASRQLEAQEDRLTRLEAENTRHLVMTAYLGISKGFCHRIFSVTHIVTFFPFLHNIISVPLQRRNISQNYIYPPLFLLSLNMKQKLIFFS
jgi:hypothetical protein